MNNIISEFEEDSSGSGVMRKQEIFLLTGFILSTGILVPLSARNDEQTKLSEDLNEEDQRRLQLLGLSDLERKGLQFALLIKKTEKSKVEPKVFEVLRNLTRNMKNVRNELVLLRDEIKACGNVSNINKCNSWKQTFNCCIGNIDAELYAITSLANIITIRAKMIRDFKYELRMKPTDVVILKRALGELTFAKRQLASGDLSEECRRTMEKVPDALTKFGKTLALARNFVQLHIDRLEKKKEFPERLFSDAPM